MLILEQLDLSFALAQLLFELCVLVFGLGQLHIHLIAHQEVSRSAQPHITRTRI